MATSNNDIITYALRKISVCGESEVPTAEQAVNGLVALNDMMAALQTGEVNLGYAPQSELTTEFPVAIEYREAIKYMFAVHQAIHYGVELSPILVAMADAGRTKILRDAVYQSIRPAVPDLPLGSGIGGRFNIVTGT